ESAGSSPAPKTSRSPPQGSPTENASSSEIPYSSSRGPLPASTSRASPKTSPSTQPPDTEPASSPLSETASFEPIGRGAERRADTTVASAPRSPRPCQRPRSFASSLLPERIVPTQRRGGE